MMRHRTHVEQCEVCYVCSLFPNSVRVRNFYLYANSTGSPEIGYSNSACSAKLNTQSADCRNNEHPVITKESAFYILHNSLFLFLNQRKNSMSTPTTTAPSAAPTTLHPLSTPLSTTCPGEESTCQDPEAHYPSTAPGLTSISRPPPQTPTHCPPRRITPAPALIGHHGASAPRTSCWHSGKATRCPVCPRTSNTNTTKPWWAPAEALHHRRSAGEIRDKRWAVIKQDEQQKQMKY